MESRGNQSPGDQGAATRMTWEYTLTHTPYLCNVTLQFRLTCTSIQYPHHPGEGVPLILIVKLVTSFLIQLRCIATSYDFVPSQINGWIDDAP